jgi:hypothetical protein
MYGPDDDRRQQDTEQERYEQEAGWLASDPGYLQWLKQFEREEQE